MRALVLVALATVGWATAAERELAAGDALPELRGEFLTGRTAILPEAARGRVALLLLGFTYDSRLAVEAWAKQFRARFGSQPDAAFFEIPMIGGFGRLGKWFIDSGMRKGTPKADHERVITVYGGVDPWKARTGYRDPKAAYLILIDKSGKVLWRHNGPYEESAFQSLAGATAPQLATPR